MLILKKVLHFSKKYAILHMLLNKPEWWNWQTCWTQNPVVATPCGFDPRFRHHNWTPVLIQCVSKRVSSFFLQKPLFTRIFLYYLTKGLWGVHFEPRGVHLLIIPIPFNDNSKGCAFRINIGHYFHNWTPILIQWVSKRVSGFFL